MELQNLNYKTQKQLLEFLFEFITDERKNRFLEVVDMRTKYLTIVLEDIFQPHNASAVLRSCDCFGIQNVHIIENKYKYNVNPDVALGSPKWLDLYRYNNGDFNTADCLNKLKDEGYRIVATTPHKNDCLIDELPLDKKTALVFGTELNGLTDTAIEMADGFVKLPMFGFTESYNISVSAALSLYELTKHLRNKIKGWELSEKEKTKILINWCLNSVNKSDMLLRKFFSKK
jgi:tRNA (guanosine-2'-O-)-methyltransferase